MVLISNYCENRYNMKNTNKNIWFTAFVKILEYLQEPLNILIDTNNSIFTTDFENIILAFLTVIIYTNK